MTRRHTRLTLAVLVLPALATAGTHVPALDLAFAASDLVVVGRADRDAFGRPAIRVIERLHGATTRKLLPQPVGVRLGIHERVPADGTAALLFLREVVTARGGRAWRLCQHPGTVLRFDAERGPRLRALVQHFGLVQRQVVGAAAALVAFAESLLADDPQLARIALRALSRRSDVLARETHARLAERFEAILSRVDVDGAVRAESACCLASLAPERARASLESLLRLGRADGVGRHVGPLLAQIAPSNAAASLVAMLGHTAPGGHVEVLRCLRSMRSADATRQLERLTRDPVFGPAMLQASLR